MAELNKYQEYFIKLVDLCDKNGLEFWLHKETYPVRMDIRPSADRVGQMSLWSKEQQDKATVTPDSCLTMWIQDGEVSWQTKSRWTISDTLFGKIKSLFKNIHYAWLQYLFWAMIEGGKIRPEDMPSTYSQEDYRLARDSDHDEIFDDELLDFEEE